MFISTIASSSRLPAIAVATASPCQSCLHRRLFSSSAPRLVKRPQKPYEAPIAKIDAYGNRIPLPSELDKGSIKTREFLEILAERRARTPTEKYGSSHGFGIKQRQRPSLNRLHVQGGASEMYQEGDGGNAVAYGERRDELWREKIGLQQHSGKGKFVSAEQRFREEAARLNRSQDNGTSGYGGTRSYDRGNRDRPSARGDNYANRTRESTTSDNIRTSVGFGIGSSPAGSDSPRKSFGLNRESSTERAPYYIPRNRSDSALTSTPNSSSSGLMYKEQSPKIWGPAKQGEFVGQHKMPSSIVFPGDKGAKKSYGIADRRHLDRDGVEGNHNHDHARSPTALRHPSTISNITTPLSQPSAPELLSETAPTTKPASRPWQPTKKLTYSAMAGLKALHQVDPDKFTRAVLSKKFGISHEAVSRILKSKYRDRAPGMSHTEAGGGDDSMQLKGTKWDRNPSTSESISPVPAILRACERINNKRD
ncbi:hypothetical protein I317_03073 [Kwoniella heveanensis CBS 569]|nr:hypothetical protein I317_03073 [Kwoniella heveanensis CBS 569]